MIHLEYEYSDKYYNAAALHARAGRLSLAVALLPWTCSMHAFTQQVLHVSSRSGSLHGPTHLVASRSPAELPSSGLPAGVA
jgi:hypothetical protein